VIEHSSQAIVFQNCFRLVRFSLQIAAQAVDPPVFRRAHLIRSESSDRGNQFVPDKFSLNDQRRRAAASAIKSQRARSLACSSIEKMSDSS